MLKEKFLHENHEIINRLAVLKGEINRIPNGSLLMIKPQNEFNSLSQKLHCEAEIISGLFVDEMIEETFRLQGNA